MQRQKSPPPPPPPPPLLRIFSMTCLCLTSFYALLSCPYSKVEESFNLQATHDLYYFGIGGFFSDDKYDYYDHLKFPGVVPRTFTGPFLLSTTIQTLTSLLSPLHDLSTHPLLIEFLSRALLLLVNLHACHHLAQSLHPASSSSSSPRTGSWYLLLTAAQFHAPYYMSRMLPNIVALPLVTHAYAYWFENDATRCVVLLTATTALIRCDVLILLSCVGLSLLYRGRLTLGRAIATGCVTVMASVLVTVPLDSMGWDRWVWPEGEVFFFNAVENRSHLWGTQPFHWYFMVALPKCLLGGCVLLPFAVGKLPEVLASWEIMRWEMRRYVRDTPRWVPFVDGGGLGEFVIPVVMFVLLYSFLPHKETRFMFVALPMLNVVAARGLERWYCCAFQKWNEDDEETKEKEGKRQQRQRYRLILTKFCFMGIIAILLLSFAVSTLFLNLSMRNYPGGEALSMLRDYMERQSSTMGQQQHKQQQPPSARQWTAEVYIDNAAAMSGVSLFGQRHASSCCPTSVTWNFHKAGYEEENSNPNYDVFTHALVEDPRVLKGFHVVGVAQGHPRLLRREMRIVTEDVIFIMERDGFWES